jgi:hypothetical protein
MGVDPRRLTGWHPIVIDEETDRSGTYRQWIVRDAGNDEVCRVFYVTADGAAQAQLIGAAPALLEALKNYVGLGSALTAAQRDQIAESAIALAEGRAIDQPKEKT